MSSDKVAILPSQKRPIDPASTQVSPRSRCCLKLIVDLVRAKHFYLAMKCQVRLAALLPAATSR
jgi:hypothetical protein